MENVERDNAVQIVFVTNFYNHHQAPLANEMHGLAENGYLFIETAEMSIERKNMGWGNENKPEYVCAYSEYKHNADSYQQLIDNAVYLIFGSAPDVLLKGRQKNSNITFRYAERFYKDGCPKWQIPLRYIRNHLRYQKNEYMLCASAYTAADAAITHNFIGRTYKWGYFTQVIEYDIKALMDKKKENAVPSILWVARLIEWKHPEVAIRIARQLKNNRYQFKLQLIGNGELENSLEALIKELDVADCVEMLGAMTPEAVRKYMEKANIFLFTSDFNEGWGAVLNESMNSGCAVVASHAIGSVPFLIENGSNGLVYKNGDMECLYNKVARLLDDVAYREKIGIEACITMRDLWNPRVAAYRFVKFAEEIRKHKNCDLFKSGPCSKAEIIENNWIDYNA